jgi:capsular polysaccharide biosynthesis protein
MQYVPDPALSPSDEALLAELVGRVVSAPAPAETLENIVAELEQAQKPAVAAALYESVCYLVPIGGYWLHFRMAKAYRALGHGRETPAFYHAATAVRLHPDWSGADQAFRHMFQFYRNRGLDRAALDLFRYQMRFVPQHPSAKPDELAPILRRLGEASALAPVPRNPAGEDAFRLHPVIAEETRPATIFPAFGGPLPYALAPLAQPMARPAIAVGEFSDAEVLLYLNAIVVVDRDGNVAEDFCVGDYPQAIRAKVAALEREGAQTPLREVEEAAIISDIFPAPNVCHFLCDQITRLDLYQRLGVDTGRALVIGPEARLPAQDNILRRAGVTDYLGTDHIVRVRARRLWVSGNCRALRHAAHLGAEWAVAFCQRILGGRGSKGWRRLYVSRDDARVRRVINEDAVMAVLEPLGFEKIVPGTMPHEAQIAAFKQASHIVAPHGAALAHLALCPPDAQALEIFHPLYGTAAYAMQAAAAGIRYAAMLARDWESDAPAWNDPTQVEVGESLYLERHIRVDLGTLSEYVGTIV